MTNRAAVAGGPLAIEDAPSGSNKPLTGNGLERAVTKMSEALVSFDKQQKQIDSVPKDLGYRQCQEYDTLKAMSMAISDPRLVFKQFMVIDVDCVQFDLTVVIVM